jgi:hypothetical protein
MVQLWTVQICIFILQLVKNEAENSRIKWRSKLSRQLSEKWCPAYGWVTTFAYTCSKSARAEQQIQVEMVIPSHYWHVRKVSRPSPVTGEWSGEEYSKYLQTASLFLILKLNFEFVVTFTVMNMSKLTFKVRTFKLSGTLLRLEFKWP